MSQGLAVATSSAGQPFWSSFARHLFEDVTRPRFETWLVRLSPRGFDDQELELVAPNAFTKDWIQRHYKEALTRASYEVDRKHRQVRILQIADLDPKDRVGLTILGQYLDQGATARPAEVHRDPPPPIPIARPQAPAEAEGPFWSEAELAAARATGEGPDEFAGTRPVPQGPAVPEDRPAAAPDQGRYNRESLSFFHENSDFLLNDGYTFENFVIGPSNQLSCAAARAVVDSPGGNYNPLFLHGSSGLGKTHLLQAICHSVLRSPTPRRVLYLSCESFVNQFISAVQNGDLESFRFKYRKVDMLLIDDVQFLEGKTRTQEEFFHTFNSLHNAGRQIVLTSDRGPKEIATLQERLVSRMRWGMVMKIEPPCFETRIAIVKRKAGLRGYDVSPEVACAIAEAIDTNIRELEGAVTKVIGLANLSGRRIDLPLVHEALRDLLPRRTGVTVQEILEAVSREFGVTAREIQGKRRSKSVVLARQVAMHQARKLTSLSLEQIGGFFGGRDHSTVLHSIKKVDAALETDRDLAQRIQRLASWLGRGRD
ncbi:MAG: chromosomal replication initiator protein DnaA [Planctomycetota bacterium]